MRIFYQTLGAITLALFCFPGLLSAQETMVTSSTGAAEVAPGSIVKSSPGSFSPLAMWDLEFDYPVGTLAGSNGQAGVIFINGEFWTSRWQSDTLYRFSSTGNFLGGFTIDNGGTPLSGTRAMTTDGTDVYIGTAGNSIFRVNPTTLSVTSTISVNSSVGGVRYITYDPTADGGNGGFWVGNFNTAFTQVSLTGATLATVPAPAGMTGKYGIAFDNVSTGGPLLWVFHQGGGPSPATITPVLIPSGTPLFTIRDVSADLGSGNDLAGGLFLSQSGAVTGKNVLLGLLQGDPGPDRMFAYELDFSVPQVDGSIADLTLTPPYTQVPERLNPSFAVGGNYANGGSQVITNLSIDVTVDSAGTQVFSQTINQANVPGFGSGSFSSNPYTPSSQGVYSIDVTAGTGAQPDDDPTNNSATTSFVVTDSLLARDDGVSTGPYNVSSTDKAFAIALFDFAGDGFLKGVEIELENPVQGDTTYGIVVQVNAGAPVGGAVIQTPFQIISDQQNTYYMQFLAPIPVQAGSTWGVGVYEGANTVIGLASSTTNFVPGINFFSTSLGTSWTPSNLPTIRFIRPVLASCSIFDATVSTTPDNGSGNGTGTVQVVNFSGAVTVVWKDNTGATVANGPAVTGLSGGDYTVEVSDQNGCSVTLNATVDSNVGIEDELAAGIYDLKLFPNPSHGQFQLEMDFDRPEALTVEVLDIRGATVFARRFDQAANQQVGIDLSAQPAGIYLLKLSTSRGSATRQLVITE